MRVIAIAVVVACGSAWVGGASAGTSRGEFIRQGDALCARAAAEYEPVRKQAQAAALLPKAQQWAAAAEVWAKQIAIQRRFGKRFRAIGIPVADRPAARIVAGLDRGVALAVRVQRSFVARDERALASALPAYVDFTLALNKRVVAYGFRWCGRTR